MNVRLFALLIVPLIVTQCPAPVYAHDSEILQCSGNLPIKSVTFLYEEVNQNGTLSEYYDRNNDGKRDIEAVSHMDSVTLDSGEVKVTHRPHPFLYIVDLDFDEDPDVVLVDKSGIGKCEDIVLYLDLHKPTAENNDERQAGEL